MMPGTGATSVFPPDIVEPVDVEPVDAVEVSAAKARGTDSRAKIRKDGNRTARKCFSDIIPPPDDVK